MLIGWLCLSFNLFSECFYLEDGFDSWPCFDVSAWHQAGSISGPLFPSRHPGTNEQQALVLQVLTPTLCVQILRVTSVDYYITLAQQRDQLLYEIIYCFSRWKTSLLFLFNNLTENFKSCDKLVSKAILIFQIIYLMKTLFFLFFLHQQCSYNRGKSINAILSSILCYVKLSLRWNENLC